ncbi:unnamed protein product [Peniophora sp. CBMAI 1063]|nr:unnamed protein product [Peniophora sp. CBMAI 1063]
MQHAVSSARIRLDSLTNQVESTCGTPSDLSSASGADSPGCGSTNSCPDAEELARRLQAIPTSDDSVTSASALEDRSEVSTTAPNHPGRRSARGDLSGSAAIQQPHSEPAGQQGCPIATASSLGKRRRSSSPVEGQPPPKLSKNAKKKALRLAKADGDLDVKLLRARKTRAPGVQSGSHRRRCEQRRDARSRPEVAPWSPKARSSYYERDRPFRIAPLDESKVELSVSSSHGAYVGGYGDDSGRGCAVSEERAKLMGLEEVEWDATQPLLILDKNEVINVAFVPPPKLDAPRQGEAHGHELECGPSDGGPVSYQEACDEVFALFGKAKGLKIPPKAKEGRRGKFIALNFGLQSGMGQARLNFGYEAPEGNEDYIQELKDSPHLQRLATWQSEIFAYWAPRAHRHVRRQLKTLHEKTGLRPPFPRSVYPTACANCGPCTVCKAHRDKTNYPSCPCCVTALGKFDPKKGGHMALPDLGIYVRFPPGASCLLSSAAMTHGNLSIQPGETRSSFTQYCVGGLMRAIAYDMRLAKHLSDEERALMDEAAGEGWDAQYARFSKVWEVDEDRAWVREQDRLELLAEEAAAG